MPYAALTRRLRTSRCLQAVVTMAAVSFMCFFDDRDLDILCNPAPIMGALGELRRGTFPGHGQLDPNMRMKSLDDCFQRLSDFDCEANYRFAKHELSQLYDSLGFPAEVRLGGTAMWYNGGNTGRGDWGYRTGSTPLATMTRLVRARSYPSAVFTYEMYSMQ